MDSRFAHIQNDPRFRVLRKTERKVKIDSRFKGMFKDKRFRVKYSVDSRGRPVQLSSSDHLKKFYELNSSEEEGGTSDDAEQEEHDIQTKTSGKNQPKSKTPKQKEVKDKNERESDNEDDQNERDDSRSGAEALSDNEKTTDDDEDEEETGDEDESDGSDDDEPDIARGGGMVESSSDDEIVDESSALDAITDIEHPWAELHRDAPVTNEATSRLAVCNLDWDNVKAADIFTLMNSFKPVGGIIHSVTVYPSDYGQARLKEEEVRGPAELTEDVKPTDEGPASEDEDEMSENAVERLRRYQLNRLRYYYAVVVCDSVDTAGHIYDECDGKEFESSATRLDLRFIPEDMAFDQEPRDTATAVQMAGYQPKFFVNTALQQSKVRCTWDQTDRDRVAMLTKDFKKENFEQMDLDAYLASETDSEGEDPLAGFQTAAINEPAMTSDPQPQIPSKSMSEEELIHKYKDLVKMAQEKEEAKKKKSVSMEVTWDMSVKENTMKAIQIATTAKLSQWEQYLEKKKEKKKQKQMERKARKLAEADSPNEFDLSSESEEEPKPVKIDKRRKGKKRKVSDEEAIDPQQKAELDLLLDDSDDGKHHFSLKKMLKAEKAERKKNKKKNRENNEESKVKEDGFKIDVGDKRFQAVFDNPSYHIDPSAKQFKPTKGMQTLLETKLKAKKWTTSTVD